MPKTVKINPGCLLQSCPIEESIKIQSFYYSFLKANVISTAGCFSLQTWNKLPNINRSKRCKVPSERRDWSKHCQKRAFSPHTDTPVTYLAMLPSPVLTDDHVFPHLQLLKYLKGWSGTSQLKEQTCKLALERQMRVINTPRQEANPSCPVSNLPFKRLLIVIHTPFTKFSVYYLGICENHTYFSKLFLQAMKN